MGYEYDTYLYPIHNVEVNGPTALHGIIEFHKCLLPDCQDVPINSIIISKLMSDYQCANGVSLSTIHNYILVPNHQSCMWIMPVHPILT